MSRLLNLLTGRQRYQRALWGLALLVVSARSAGAQEDTVAFPSLGNLSVKVEGTVTTQNGAAVRLDYKLTNLGGSQQPAADFLIRALVPFNASYGMNSPVGWFASKAIIEDSAVARWFAIEANKFLTAGTSKTGYVTEVNGVLDVVQAWVQGEATFPTLEEGQTLGEEPSVYVNSAATLTIGPIPVPAGSTVGSLVTRLNDLVSRVCASPQWITSSGLCTTLAGQLTGNPVDLSAFRDTLTANRSGGAQLTDNPYYLLKSNRDYIRYRIDVVTPDGGFGLVYVCGNKFKARNKTDIPLPATYTVQNTSETGSLVLPAKPAGSTFSETEFTTTNQGTVKLWYDGVVQRQLTPTYVACGGP